MQKSKITLLLLSLISQNSAAEESSSALLRRVLRQHAYVVGISLVTLTASVVSWNWWTAQHHNRYKLEASMLPEVAADARQITLFAHGAFDASRQVLAVTNYKEGVPYLVANNVVTFDFDDSFAHSRLPFWCFKGCLGQDADVAHIRERVTCIRQEYTALEKLVLIGISRGASAVVNYGTEGVAARILESPFDSVEELLPLRAQKMGVSTAVVNRVKPLILAVVAGEYRSDGMQPIDTVQKTQDDIPTLLVAVQHDHAVPYACTVNLYNAMRAQGCKKVHLLTLQQGRHGALLRGSDGQRYQDVAHAFFRHYGLEHNPAYADRGAAEFQTLLAA